MMPLPSNASEPLEEAPTGARGRILYSPLTVTLII